MGRKTAADGHAPADAGAIPTYAERSAAPRDLRTAEELAQHDYTRLGAPRARLLSAGGGEVLLYSTSEARRLKHDLWPRCSRLTRADAPAPDRPLGAVARTTNPGASSAPRPGEPGHASGRHGPADAPTARTLLSDPTAWLAALFDEGFVVLDTETTGLGRQAEIIEIAAVDNSGAVLLESKVWPRSGRVPAAASRVHGLTIGDLQGAPTWPELLLELERQLNGRRVLAWNAPFDERMALQTSRLWSLAPRLPAFECAMRGYARVRGLGSTGMRLERAAQVERVLTAPQEHRSLGDAQLVLAVLERLTGARAVPA